jgi:hypothetical protein
MWHMAGNAKVTPEMQFILPVRDNLERMLNKFEKLLRSGSTEERLSFCEETYDEIDATKAENAYVDEEPHKWALEEVEIETDWLCKNWVPERKLQFKDHLDGIKEVLQLYDEKLQCMPGDVACIQGQLVGVKPECGCKCFHGWIGEACHERNPDYAGGEIVVRGAQGTEHPRANGFYHRDGDFNGKPLYRNVEHPEYTVGQWSDGDWSVLYQGSSYIWYTSAFRSSAAPPAKWTSGTVEVAMKYELEAKIKVENCPDTDANGWYVRDGSFNGRPLWRHMEDPAWTVGMWSDGDWSLMSQGSEHGSKGWKYYTTMDKFGQEPPDEWTAHGAVIKLDLSQPRDETHWALPSTRRGARPNATQASYGVTDAATQAVQALAHPAAQPVVQRSPEPSLRSPELLIAPARNRTDPPAGRPAPQERAAPARPRPEPQQGVVQQVSQPTVRQAPRNEQQHGVGRTGDQPLQQPSHQKLAEPEPALPAPLVAKPASPQPAPQPAAAKRNETQRTRLRSASSAEQSAGQLAQPAEPAPDAHPPSSKPPPALPLVEPPAQRLAQPAEPPAAERLAPAGLRLRAVPSGDVLPLAANATSARPVLEPIRVREGPMNATVV